MDKIIVDMDKLTDRQKEVFLLSEKGMKLKEIAEILGCTYQNVDCILKTIHKNAENGYQRRNVKKPGKYNYKDNYKDADLSVLGKKEREIIEKRIEGKSYTQIAKEMGTTPSSVGVQLYNARAKMENRETYQQKNRDKYNARRRGPEHKEQRKKWHKNFANAHPEYKEKLSEYNKKYYAKNKEKILERRKQRQEEKKVDKNT